MNDKPKKDGLFAVTNDPSGGMAEIELSVPRRRRAKDGGYAEGTVGRPPGFAPFRKRSDVERAARRVVNMIIGGQLDPQMAHAVLHALRLVFDSMRATENIEAEFKLRQVTDEVVHMRELNQELYRRLVELGVAPPLKTDLSA